MPPKKTTAPVKKAATGSKTTTKTPAKTTTKTAAKKEEPKKEEPKVETPPKKDPIVIQVKAIKLQLVEDAQNNIRGSGRAAFVSDNTDETCTTFMKYAGPAIQYAQDIFKPGGEENLRLASISAVRQGKPLVIFLDKDFQPDEKDKDKEIDVAQLEKLSAHFDKLKPGMMQKLSDRTILSAIQNDEWYDALVKGTDGEIYQKFYFLKDEQEMSEFKFFLVVISSNQAPGRYIQDNFTLFTIAELN